MGCGSCGTSHNGLPKGCNNNGACGVDGCDKLSVFDWLSNMRLPNGQMAFDCVEIRFKNDRKQYFRNVNALSLNVGEVVAVEGNPGHDIGVVALTGELVRIQMKKKRIAEDSEEIKKIFRKANEKDIQIWQEFREKEKQTMIDARIIASRLNLEMKICDVEYQGDGAKVIFYYTAEGRVDFRQLIKEYASKFGVRIEMKQIGYRQEAAKVGGIGSCGRELCCSTWLTDFRSVSTAAARYQQLSINSQKLAGQCGKLKCCLNFELDSYLDALQDFPGEDTKIETENGKAHCMKIDVFKKEMWFTYEKGSVIWFKLSVNQVKEVIELNKNGKVSEPLEELSKEEIQDKPVFTDVIEENSLERFERKNKNNRNRNSKNNKRNTQNNSAKARPEGNAADTNQGNRPNAPKKPKNPQANQNKNVQNSQNKNPQTIKNNPANAGNQNKKTQNNPNKNQPQKPKPDVTSVEKVNAEKTPNENNKKKNRNFKNKNRGNQNRDQSKPDTGA